MGHFQYKPVCNNTRRNGQPSKSQKVKPNIKWCVWQAVLYFDWWTFWESTIYSNIDYNRTV